MEGNAAPAPAGATAPSEPAAGTAPDSTSTGQGAAETPSSDGGPSDALEALSPTPSGSDPDPVGQEAEGSPARTGDRPRDAAGRFISPEGEWSPAPPGEVSPEQGSEPQEPAPPQTHRVKLKIDGQEVEREVTHEQLVSALQRQDVSMRRMQEAQRALQSTQKLFDSFRTDPAEALRQLGAHKELEGVDLDSAYQKLLMERYRRMSLSDEQRELEDLRKEKQSREQEAERARTEAEQRQRTERIKQARQQLEEQIVAAVQASDLPEHVRASPQVFRRVASYMRQAASSNPPVSITPQQAVGLVREDIEQEQRAYLTGVKDPDQLVQLLTPEQLSAIRQRQLSEAQQRQQTAQVVTPSSPRQERVRPARPKTARAMLDEIESQRVRPARRR